MWLIGKMGSNKRAVCGRMDSAQCTIRDGVHFQMFLVGAWAMFGNGYGVLVATCTQTRRYTLALMEELDSGRRRAHFHQFMHQVVRHAVVDLSWVEAAVVDGNSL